MAGMAEFTDASHNMLFTLTPAKWLEDLRKSNQADLVGYQEAEGQEQRDTIKAFCERNNRGLYLPSGTGCGISWKRTVFTAIRGEAYVIEVHQKHPTAAFNPHRDIVARGLRHNASGKRFLRINIHPVAGAYHPESSTEWSDEVDQWKNWALANYYLDLVAFTAAQMSREYYQAILLGGDYNAPMDNTKAWYYPARLLNGLYVRDNIVKGIDHMQHTHGSDVSVTRRWSVAANSDHRIHFTRRLIVNVPDYPGVM